MDLLPDLAIEEDIANLGLEDNDDDDLTMEEMEGKTEKLPEAPIQKSDKDLEHEDIFIDKPTTKNTKPKLKTINEEEDFDEEKKRIIEKPKKKKKEISEKQRAHLDRIRAKALETKKAKAKAKAEKIKEVKESFKKKPKTKTDEKFEEKIENDNIERTKKEKDKDFNSFHLFMENMNKFENMKRDYNIQQNKKMEPRPSKPEPKPQIKKPNLKPSILTPKIENDPYADWF